MINKFDGRLKATDYGPPVLHLTDNNLVSVFHIAPVVRDPTFSTFRAGFGIGTLAVTLAHIENRMQEI